MNLSVKAFFKAILLFFLFHAGPAFTQEAEFIIVTPQKGDKIVLGSIPVKALAPLACKPILWTTSIGGRTETQHDEPGSIEFNPFPGSNSSFGDQKVFASTILALGDLVINNLQPPENSVTKDRTPTLSATITDGSCGEVTARLIVDDDSEKQVEVKGVLPLVISYTPTDPLSEGAHNVRVTAVDSILGKISIKTWYFTIDTTPPVVTGVDEIETTLDCVPGECQPESCQDVDVAFNASDSSSDIDKFTVTGFSGSVKLDPNVKTGNGEKLRWNLLSVS